MPYDLRRILIAVSAMLCMVFGVCSALAAPQEPAAVLALADLPDDPAVEADDALASLLLEVATSMDHAFITEDDVAAHRKAGLSAPVAWQVARLASGRAIGALDRPPRAV